VFTTVDAGVVEGRVVRAEGATTAVPEGRHCSGNVERRGGVYQIDRIRVN